MDSEKIHMFFFPQLFGGHLIPMIDAARVFAAHGVKATIITTPINALNFQKSIQHDQQSGHDINFHTVALPAAEFGLQDGCENLPSVTNADMTAKLFHASMKLQGPVEQLLQEQRPDCIVSDMFYIQTTYFWKKIGIPRISFYVTGCFSLCAAESIRRHKPQEKVSSETEPFTLPGLPDKIELTRLTIPKWFLNKSGYGELLDTIVEADVNSYGVIINSFLEMESPYADYYKNEMGRKTWHVGPVSLCNKSDKFDRGMKASIDEHSCLSWLDCKEPNSVLYISFGSLPNVAHPQLLEIARGLEESNHPFIWVIGKILKDVASGSHDDKEEDDNWLPDGFKERMTSSNRGLIIEGWAPQLMILEHVAVGGFMMHCGWNSTMEALTNGLPLITWPLTSEQFFNEKLLVDVLKVGIPVGTEKWLSPNESKVTVTREKVAKAVVKLMGGKEDNTLEIRRRAKEIGKKAKGAVVQGGSSYRNVEALIEELKSNRK